MSWVAEAAQKKAQAAARKEQKEQAVRQAEDEVVTWIEKELQETKGSQSFAEWLSDGRILCIIANMARPGIVKQIKTHKALHHDNIISFCSACRKLGIKESIVLEDVVKGKDMPRVVRCLQEFIVLFKSPVSAVPAAAPGDLAEGAGAQPTLLQTQAGADSVPLLQQKQAEHTKEEARKKALKEEAERQSEEEVVSWIEHEVQESKGVRSLAEWLHDGRVLCTLANRLQPGIIKKINTMKVLYKDNIMRFSKACEQLGVKKGIDVEKFMRGDDMPGVHRCLRELMAISKGGEVPEESETKVDGVALLERHHALQKLNEMMMQGRKDWLAVEAAIQDCELKGVSAENTRSARDVLKEGKQRDERNRVLANLENAKKGDNCLAALTEAIEAARAFGLAQENIDSAVQDLEAEKMRLVMMELETAQKQPVNLGRLQAAIQAAEARGADVAPVEAAKGVHAKEERLLVVAMLEEAMQYPVKVEGLRLAMQQYKDFNLPSFRLTTAQNLLEKAEESEALKAELKAAVKEKSAEKTKALIMNCLERLSNKELEEIEEVQAYLREESLQKLQCALSGEDAQSVEIAIQDAFKVGVSNEQLREATKELLKRVAHCQDLELVTRAIRLGELAGLEDMDLSSSYRACKILQARRDVQGALSRTRAGAANTEDIAQLQRTLATAGAGDFLEELADVKAALLKARQIEAKRDIRQAISAHDYPVIVQAIASGMDLGLCEAELSRAHTAICGFVRTLINKTRVEPTVQDLTEVSKALELRKLPDMLDEADVSALLNILVAGVHAFVDKTQGISELTANDCGTLVGVIGLAKDAGVEDVEVSAALHALAVLKFRAARSVDALDGAVLYSHAVGLSEDDLSKCRATLVSTTTSMRILLAISKKAFSAWDKFGFTETEVALARERLHSMDLFPQDEGVELVAMVQRLFDSTFASEAPWRMKVVEVQKLNRFENQFAYREWKRSMLKECTADIPRNVVLTDQMAKSELAKDLDLSANECLLFHGTSTHSATRIGFQEGFKLPQTDVDRRCGAGIYLAESAMQSTFYNRNSRFDRCWPILINKACLGNVRTTYQKYEGAKEDVEAVRSGSTFHSVCGDYREMTDSKAGGYREHVVYNVDQICPGYLVWYEATDNDEMMNSMSDYFLEKYVLGCGGGVSNDVRA